MIGVKITMKLSATMSAQGGVGGCWELRLAGSDPEIPPRAWTHSRPGSLATAPCWLLGKCSAPCRLLVRAFPLFHASANAAARMHVSHSSAMRCSENECLWLPMLYERRVVCMVVTWSPTSWPCRVKYAKCRGTVTEARMCRSLCREGITGP